MDSVVNACNHNAVPLPVTASNMHGRELGHSSRYEVNGGKEKPDSRFMFVVQGYENAISDQSRSMSHNCENNDVFYCVYSNLHFGTNNVCASWNV